MGIYVGPQNRLQRLKSKATGNERVPRCTGKTH